MGGLACASSTPLLYGGLGGADGRLPPEPVPIVISKSSPPMSDRDFFREVNEAVRQDRYNELWDKYGVYALAAAALIVAGVAGFKVWSYWQEQKAQAAGSDFSQAVTELDRGDVAKARDVLNSLAAKGPTGYQILSRFQLAAAEAQAGTTDKALALYDALAADPETDT